MILLDINGLPRKDLLTASVHKDDEYFVVRNSNDGLIDFNGNVYVPRQRSFWLHYYIEVSGKFYRMELTTLEQEAELVSNIKECRDLMEAIRWMKV